MTFFLQVHYTKCPKYPVICDRCHVDIDRDRLEEHQLDGCSVVECEVPGCGKLIGTENSDLRKYQGECETLIYKLKQKIGDLEEQLRVKSPPSISSESSTDNSVEISKLEKEIEQLSLHNQQLRNTNAELYDINQRWADDYSILAQQIANTSSCYSASSTGAQSPSVLAECIHCQRLEREPDEEKTEIEQLQADVERSRDELQALQQSREQRNSELHQLENENRQLKKDHQNGVAERLQLLKQIEKLRNLFLATFPTSSIVNERGPSHYSAEPPTPPGLIARRDNSESCTPHLNELRFRRRQHYSAGPPTPPDLSLKELVKLPVAAHWHELGIQLGVPTGNLKEFQVNYPHRAQLCLHYVFDWWLKNGESPTHSQLAEALEAIDRRDLAKKVRSQVVTEGEKQSGFRKLWGAVKNYTTGFVEGILERLGSFTAGLRVRKKYKKHNDVKRWWFELKAEESVLQALECSKEWKKWHYTTGWRLGACFMALA